MKNNNTEKTTAAQFVEFWADRGDEKQHTQSFWLSLLRNVLHVTSPEKIIDFEKRVKIDGTKYIDGYIAETSTAIEQKGAKIDLDKPERQSDGTMLTPYEQAKRYNDNLPYSERCRWIVVCNFTEFRIYDMEKAEPEKCFDTILLKDLANEDYRLQFLVNRKNENIRREEEISLQAGELVGKLYDALVKEYITPDAQSLRSLNILCVRIVFCLFAEDAGLFGSRTAFEDYIRSFALENVRKGLIELFKALDTKVEKRDKYDTKLQPFPYVNGGLFHDEQIEIPNFTQEIVDVICNHCAPFNWSAISPTIFGAVFESTLNPETRRKGGMHYTSVANIHKVIDPLFMDDLRAEFGEIVASSRTQKKRRSCLLEFQKKLGALKFLDPACGSGNFLTETYLSLRRLENEVIMLLNDGESALGFDEFIHVKISQFYGIEINDFAVTVAKTALWIAESQMIRETERILSREIDFLPLTDHANIIEGNALQLDWTTLADGTATDLLYTDKLNVYMVRDDSSLSYGQQPLANSTSRYFKELNVVAKEIEERHWPENKPIEPVVYDYIIGNPPFIGARWMDKQQKDDVLCVFGKNWQGIGDLDYVCCWYKKATDVIRGTKTRCAFVSTNSVTQGGMVANLWKPLLTDGLHIDFAWRTFKWENETADKANMAAVHCVIVGFSMADNPKPKVIFLNDKEKVAANNINGYLLDAPNVAIESRNIPLCPVPEIGMGNQPIDNGLYLFTDEEKVEFVKKEPQSEVYFRKWLGGDEFINGHHRWCLWLGDCTPTQLRKMHYCMERIRAVQKYRFQSKRIATLKLAEYPTHFQTENMPKTNFIAIPEVSSERRRYIPIGFLTPEVLCSNKLRLMPNATLYHFGILTSNVHNIWMRAVCGRLKSDYSYSNTIVYNNFPWPSEARQSIESTAQNILDARALYPDASLADLYDEAVMPPELRRAHRENDAAVMSAYGFSPKMSEAEIVARLFEMYEALATQK